MKVSRPLLLIFTLATSAIINTPSFSESSESILPFPENFVVDGIPAPSKSLVKEIEPYNNFRYADLQSWHPEKREMLITTRFSDISQIHLVKFPGGARTQLTFFKDLPNLAAFEPTSGELFTFEKDNDGNENSQKYVFDLRDHKSTLLSDGKSRNNGGMWSNKGDRYCYLSTRRNGEDDDAYIVYPRTPSSDHLAAKCKGGEWDTFDWSPDDATVLLSQFVSLDQRNLYLMDSSSGALTLLTTDDGKGKIVYSGGKFSKDKLGVFTTTDKDSDFQRLAYIDLKTRKHTYLSTNIPWDIEQFALSWDGKTIAAVANDDGLSTLHLFDTASNKEQPAPALPKGIIGSIYWHKNNQDLGFTFENARSQPDVYSVNLSSGKLERWTESETGDVDTSTFSDARLFHWKAFDDRQLSGFVYTPPAKFTGKRPVIINIHGGPVAQSRPEFLGRNNYFLNELGVAIVYPNVRGSTGYGKRFMGLDNVLKREDAYKDASNYR
ncbi:MAG: S9 family peptidase [Leptolyngbya sp.]|nr:S9 family peptidase [Candidatus Melainabacteria bacterium]